MIVPLKEYIPAQSEGGDGLIIAWIMMEGPSIEPMALYVDALGDLSVQEIKNLTVDWRFDGRSQQWLEVGLALDEFEDDETEDHGDSEISGDLP